MNRLPEALTKELAALAGKSEDAIDFSDLPPTTRGDGQGAERGKFIVRSSGN